MAAPRSIRVISVLLFFCLLAGCLATGASGRASARGASAGALGLVPATKIVIFHPSSKTTGSVTGDCGMGESGALDRADAWRCMAGNIIYDPCFSAAPHATSVICGATPDRPVGILLKLAKPLPAHAAAHGRQVWMMRLGDGATCGFLTGATGGVGTERINYGCTDKYYVLGDPWAQGKVWYATEAKINGFAKATAIWAISIATIWK